MHYKSQNITPTLENPFEYDLLDREKYANTLTQIIQNTEGGFTLSIDADWGYGKTTFVRMWEKSLQNSGVSTIYLNAWETDFSQDPLMALIDSMVDIIKAKDFSKDKYALLAPMVQGLIDIAKSIPGIAWAGHIASIVKGTTDAAMTDKDDLDTYRTSKSILEAFKKALSAYTKEIGDKLVIFVDELDRCRPSYAIEMLERIKHLFDVPNIVFVLSIDKSVILESIRGFYNSSAVNAESYLRRFIDLSFTLPEPKLDEFIRALYQQHHLDECLDGYQAYIDRSYAGKDHSLEIQDTLCKCFQSSNLSLRDVEKYFNRLELVFHALNMCRADKDFVIYLLYVYMFKPNAYALMTKRNTTEDSLMLEFESELFDDVARDGHADNYMIYVICLFSSVCCRQNNIQSMSQQHLEQFAFNKLTSSNFSNIYRAAQNACTDINSDYIMNVIEMVNTHFNWNKEQTQK